MIACRSRQVARGSGGREYLAAISHQNGRAERGQGYRKLAVGRLAVLRLFSTSLKRTPSRR